MMKRLFDFSCSVVGLILLCPFLVVIAIAVKLDSRGPAFYCGRRAGLKGRPFWIWKFRTMVVDAETVGGPSTAVNDLRITRIGRFLRRYKLDEFPQLWNVVRGEMSLVGPRPEVLSEVETYTPEERQLLSVLPGITDWASLYFRNEGELLMGSEDSHLTYRQKIRPEKVRLGLSYVRERSFLTDIRIIVATLRAISFTGDSQVK